MTYYATHPQSYYGQGGVSADLSAWPGTSVRPRCRSRIYTSTERVEISRQENTTMVRRRIASSCARRLAEGMKAAWNSMVKTPISASDVGWRFLGVALPVAEPIRDQAKLRVMIADTKQPARARLTAARDLAFARLRGGKQANSGDPPDAGTSSDCSYAGRAVR